ncbi:dehydrogenase E1 component-domain-containing protein [Thamnocephalis sphaerospora]|uniref:Pyruvate dehydrogenase E1 component subunit alpha n=1 Tax=Thamnocephalis sphaerospora TaxID=78915 RepID=A0A4P9XW34_9FUNG|nr:dehydrogenase E1 component-domain-containing protein [Thamnocephalis sphaerospora]|eukprot:RKP10535.1 dehydrogenase E1 component-domain-containing protein [Thamnocephalis sphaerospora]
MVARRGLATTADEDHVNITLPGTSFEVYNCDMPSLDVAISKEELMDTYRQMVVVRRMEMAADGLYKAKMIRGFCHLCTGQEAVPVGMEQGITKEDVIITAYRCHGYAYMRGASVTSIIAELMGRSNGITKGKGGSMHMFAPNFYGGNGIVGAQVPVGAGLSFTQKYQDQKACTFALYGDGASNQGQVFEAFNMARLWDLPTVFVCENNMYGMGTSAKRSSASTDYFKRAGYIPGIKVNGMDVLAVRQACAYAREWTTSGKGPLVLEMVTYRYGGHSMSDPGTTYRTREEIQHMRSRNDPITGLKQRILEHQVADETTLKQIEKEVRAEVDQSVQEAKDGKEPDESELFTDIYIKGTEPSLLRGRDLEETHYY